MSHRAWVVAAAVAAIAAVVASTALADTTTDYPPSADARSFGTSVGGWQSAKFDMGLTCVLKPLTCPVLTNSWQSSGGAAGDGYIRTSLAALTGVASDSFGVWASPAFTYNGANGQTPTSVTLSFDRKANDSDLVDPNIGNHVTYTAAIVDSQTGNIVASRSTAGRRLRRVAGRASTRRPSIRRPSRSVTPTRSRS